MPWSGPVAKRIAVDLYDIRRLRTILLQAIERDGAEVIEASPVPGRYARPGSVFAVGRGEATENGSER